MPLGTYQLLVINTTMAMIACINGTILKLDPRRSFRHCYHLIDLLLAADPALHVTNSFHYQVTFPIRACLQ
jgi:hypothetical protein